MTKEKWIAIIFLFLFGGILTWHFISSSPKDTLKEDTNAVGYDPKIKEPENFTSNQVALPGFSEIKVKEGDQTATVALANPPFNKVYFKYVVTLNEIKDTLLETELIAPGKAIKEIPLPKNLSVGIYTVTIVIKTYDMKTKAALNGGANQTPLIVENS
ncbi:hypothetical protein [Enterococcus avium]|uniref:hypothetical protein n=1 Tax=Enterococcus avium TaxID=33945 RepID=UPI001F58D129|nr:hypothetical protein [Enterococcus avium]